jgi:peptidoglycan/xylan/chitin deacetylase (PgdA/CDA1 family)
MTHIAENGWTVVSTTQVVEWLASGGTLPERSVALHFDNGWLDARTMVMPILRELDMTGTCYVISEGVEAATAGRPAAILTSTEGAVQKPCITWRQAEELLDAGWEIGAHTATHPRLAEVQAGQGDEAVIAEIERSNEAYAENLGFVPAHFAYPSGSRSERTDALLAPYYRSLRLWHFSHPPVWSFTDAGTSPLALDCQNIDSTVGFDDFARIFEEALDNS